jgi:hypothetical protein
MKTITFLPKAWARIMVVLGSIAMLVGALDPLEGSIVILIGSALMALGTGLGQGERRLINYRILVFLLIAVGVGALWVLSASGGLGGASGHNPWWGVLILPYLIGWLMGIWGPGNPRWFLALAIMVGLWFLALGGLVLSHPSRDSSVGVVISLAALGLVTIGGCIVRLQNRHS